MKRLLILGFVGMLLCCAQYKCQAQGRKDTVYIAVDKEKGYDKKKKLFAYYAINQLKNGVLLVMLHNRDETIARYRQHDGKEIADRLMVEQTLENQMIINAFKENFHFCPVYFFFDTHIDDVKNGKYKGIFLNDSLKEDDQITLQAKYFMIADFSPLEEESFEFVQEGGHPSSTQTSTGERSLLVRDNYFVQMRAPFPYATSARITKNADRQVTSLNNKLLKFYDKHKDPNAKYPFTAVKK